MGFKITGSTLVWVIALVAGLLAGRNYLRGQFVAMLQDDKYGIFPDSPPISEMDFDKPLDFTMTQPIFPEGVIYKPEQ